MADTCQVMVVEKVDVSADVTITPSFRCGDLRASCGEGRILPGRRTRGKRGQESCCVTIWQELCVEVPLRFGASTRCRSGEVSCL